MAKFIFRMQGFLNVREKIEEQKKLEYGRAVSKLQEEREKKRLLIEEKDNLIHSFRRSINEKITPDSFRSINNYIEHIKKRIIEQERLVVVAEKYAETKRLELVESVKERKMLDTLKERAYEEFRREEKLSVQKIIDEVVSYKYGNHSINS